MGLSSVLPSIIMCAIAILHPLAVPLLPLLANACDHSIDLCCSPAKLSPREAMMLVSCIDTCCLPIPLRMGKLIFSVLQMPSTDLRLPVSRHSEAP